MAPAFKASYLQKCLLGVGGSGKTKSSPAFKEKDKMKATELDAKKLYVNLHNKGFVKSKNINMSSRKIRACVEQHPELFLSSLQGFKLIEQATASEIEHSVNDHQSRARILLNKARVWTHEGNKKFYPKSSALEENRVPE